MFLEGQTFPWDAPLYPDGKNIQVKKGGKKLR